MNRSRVAALLRELADEIDKDGEEDRPSEPRRRRERRPRALTPPPGEATPIVQAAAARLLRDRGYR